MEDEELKKKLVELEKDVAERIMRINKERAGEELRFPELFAQTLFWYGLLKAHFPEIIPLLHKAADELFEKPLTGVEITSKYMN